MEIANHPKSLIDNDVVAFGLLQVAECSASEDVNYKSISGNLKDSSLKKYFGVLQTLSTLVPNKSIEVLEQIQSEFKGQVLIQSDSNV